MKTALTTLFLAAACSAFGATLTLTPSADTTLWERNPNNNLGADILAAGSIRETTITGQPYRTRALIKFDFAGKIPAGATITSVKLTVSIAAVPTPPAPASTFELHRMLKDWGEGAKAGVQGLPATTGEATWVAPKLGGPGWTEPGAGGADDSSSTISSSTLIDANPTCTFPSTGGLIADAQSWIANPSSNFGWMMKSNDEGEPKTARRFDSRETSATTPSLEITFSEAPPEVRIQQFELTANGMALTWTGGNPPYRVERAGAITGPWVGVTPASAELQAVAPLGGANAFYRVASEAP